MSHYQKLKCMLLLLVAAVSANAQIENGKVYNIVNVDDNSRSLAIISSTAIGTVPTNRADYSQLWYASKNSDNSYSFRNLQSGRYLHSSNAASTQWTQVKNIGANCKFNFTDIGSGYAIRATNTVDTYHYMHNDGSNNVVGWESNNTSSQWTVRVVSISASDLETNWAELETVDPSDAAIATYKTSLGNLFTDNACTELKKYFASEAAVKADDDYNALPAALQEMVLKVYKSNWSESNFNTSKPEWDSQYAKKYRVQLYEPYNEPEEAAKALTLNAHTNLNNPTGIFTDGLQPLYVMVEGAIEDGATLYLDSYTGHGKAGAYNKGVELKEGLNIIPTYTTGMNYFINYVVKTFDTSGGKRGNNAKARRLSDYPNLKIHIEGGYINGYYNKVGDELYGAGDKNANWNYIEERATQTDVTVLGKYITLQFPLNDADTEGNKGLGYYFNEKVNIEEAIDEWDKVMVWERLLLGVVDQTTIDEYDRVSPYSNKKAFGYTGDDSDFATGYADYYNVHGLSFGVGGSSYMYGSWDHCGYHYNTMEGVIQNLPDNAGSHWGPAHEIGHQHQGIINMRGETEVTNNLFSNMVLWYFGETTSRVNGDEGSLSNVLANFNNTNGHYLTNSIWGMTHMYYKLFLYYHVLGHNRKFYPRLFEMLRQDPMDARGENVDGAKAHLHLYKKMCQASGEDLTEFFRAHGFFKPLSNFQIDDYGVSTYNMTQSQIDDAINEVKKLKLYENIAVLFINDATGETIKSHKGGNLEIYGETTICAEIGSYASFSKNTTPEYTYTISGKTIKMSGNGGVGFAVFNENNELISFSDKKTFTISNGCATAINSGRAKVKAVQANQNLITVPNIMDTEDNAAKRTALGDLLETARKALALTDNTGTKVGYYWPASTSTLQELYNAAKEVYDTQNEGSYASVYRNLLQGMNELQNNKDAHVGFMEGNAYRLTNKAYSSLSMSISNGELIGEATNDTDRQKWYFEPAETDGRYYLKNKATQTYPGNVATSKMPAIDATSPADAYAYELVDMGNGLWALVGSTGLHCDAYHKIVGWDINENPSQWYITAVELSQDIATDLQELINETEELIGLTGSITASGNGKVTLTEENFYTNAECKDKSYGEEFTSYSVLYDNDPYTYLHTDYSSEAPNEDHYIRIDLGAGKELSEFSLYYRTRVDGNLCAPTEVAIEASQDANTWVTLREVTSGLPETPNTEYTFEDLGNGTAYRYIRMRVFENSTRQLKNGHYYFALSEMGIESKASYNATLNETYSSIESSILLEAYKAMVAAQETLEAGQPLEYANALRTLTEKHNALVAARKAVDNKKNEALKSQLTVLASEIAGMVDECGTIVYVPETADGVLPLQADNANACYHVSSNADQNTGGGVADGGGIKALVDNNMNTYFHTRWTGEAVNEPHYIQIDMGEENAIDAFSFSYKPRDPSPAPAAITIYGSNDGTTFTDVIASITSGLPAYNSNETYTSQKFEAKTAYRYLRFTITRSLGPANAQHDDGQYFFGMLEFDLTASGHPESYTITWKKEAGSVTEDLLLSAYSLYKETEAFCQQEATDAEIQTAIDNLTAKKEELYNAMQVKYPVTFTQDKNAPVLYNIKNKEGYLLQYDESTGMSSLHSEGTNDIAEQAFYFVRDNHNAQVYIYPYMADGKLLAANDITDGDSKVIAMDKGTATYEQWSFIKRTGQNYNLQLSGTDTYLNCNGNAGFNSESPENTNGSLFAFTSSSVNGCPAYHRLKSYHSKVKQLYGTSITGGDAPGYYPAAKAKAYNEAYTAATAALRSTDTEELVCRSAHEALEAATRDLEIIMPEEGRFYRIKNYVTKNGFMYVGTSNRLSYKKTNVSDASDIFQFVKAEEGYYLYNVARGTYLSVAEDNGKQIVSNAASTANAKKIAINSFNNGTTPQVSFATEEEAKIQAGKNGTVICGSEAESGTEAAWYITEVEEDVIKHVLSVTATGWETLTLAFNAEIPADVTAYKVTGIIDGNAIIKAISGVLPANTPVLIKAEKGTYEFTYTAADAVVEGNILDGKPYNTTISTDNGFANYMLDTNNGITGLYLQTGTISIDANKAYLSAPDDSTTAPSLLYITENYEEDKDENEGDEEGDEENGDGDEPGNEEGDEENGDGNEPGNEEGDEENGDGNEPGNEEGDEENGDGNEPGNEEDDENGDKPGNEEGDEENGDDGETGKDDDDENVGISETKSETKKQVVYDLSGNRVDKMEKGIYIVNGKKVIVK